MVSRGRQLLSVLLALVLAAAPVSVHSANPAVSEYAIKSALLLKLTRFVYLPTGSHAGQLPVLCVLGSNPFGNTLHELNQATGPEKQVQLKLPASAADAADCKFVFISRSEHRRLGQILRQLAQYKLVTISDIRGFAHSGGMVELALEDTYDSSINILINRHAAARQGIKFNAQLLRLATLVRE